MFANNSKNQNMEFQILPIYTPSQTIDIQEEIRKSKIFIFLIPYQ
jgi:hypothetical protein